MIFLHLKPAYEDLFDMAEEQAVEVLLEQWNALCSQEARAFQEVKTILFLNFKWPFFIALW